MNRVSFIIDGFNLYHSLRTAQNDLDDQSTKWLNIHSLLESYIYLFGRSAKMQEIYYFSALAKHLEAYQPEVTNRHRLYLDCLASTGLIIKLHKFQKGSIRCQHCNGKFNRYEEKETDVAIAVKVLELLIKDRCDTIVLVSGDTDLLPAVETALNLFPHKKIVFAFPYRRKNKVLANIAVGSFSMSKEQYVKHQFPQKVVLGNGKIIEKPISW